MDRRKFIKNSVSASAASLFPIASTKAQSIASMEPFKVLFAPHFGMCEAIVGEDLVDQLRYMHDQGFRAWEDNRMMRRSVSEQNKIAREMERLEMKMGVFVAYADFKTPSFSGNQMPDSKPRERDLNAVRAMLKDLMYKSVETAKRVNAKWVTVVPGTVDLSLEEGYQFQNVVDTLKYCAEILESAGVIMVLEPLNHMNHPGLFLKYIPQAYTICKAVNSPSCKILNDLYHQQISEGNLIPNIDRAWDEIAYFQIGDNPGRKEPTTGEINYKNVFQYIHNKGYEGIYGMEHGLSRKGPEGVKGLIDAYRSVDVTV